MKRIFSILLIIVMALSVIFISATCSDYSADDNDIVSEQLSVTGTEYTEEACLTEPYLSSYGVKLTVHGLYDVRDLFIAQGEFDSYREIKDNGYIFSVGAAKIGTKDEYTYILSQAGIYTVLIRYNDGSQRIFHETLTVDEPCLRNNGLQLIVSNIEDVKVIRTAYGKWNTTKELKATDTIRNFPAKTAIKGVDPYTIQYRKEGTVTVIVEYNNGYKKVFHCKITKKKPTVIQQRNVVTFDDLDGLVTIRYAKGEYSASSQIKNAKGSKVLKSSDTVDGRISVTLETGIYTFCVQYDDESFNYYTLNTTETEGSFSKCYEYTDAEGNQVDSLPYWLYTPSNITDGMPLIVALHSADAKIKNDYTPEENLDNMVQGNFVDIPKYIYNGDLGDIPAYVIMPQTSASSRGWSKRGEELIGLVEYCKREFKVDSDRISLIGFSLGATGGLELASAYPEVFDRIISVAGGLDGITNNTRPYVSTGTRITLSDNLYPHLRVLKTGSTDSYEKETMKYLFASGESRYHATTDAEIVEAKEFFNDRIKKTATSLNGRVAVWCIVGDKDTDVYPCVSEELCRRTLNARCDVMQGYSHAAILKYCKEIKNDIIDFLTEDQ